MLNRESRKNVTLGIKKHSKRWLTKDLRKQRRRMPWLHIRCRLRKFKLPNMSRMNKWDGRKQGKREDVRSSHVWVLSNRTKTPKESLTTLMTLKQIVEWEKWRRNNHQEQQKLRTAQSFVRKKNKSKVSSLQYSDVVHRNPNQRKMRPSSKRGRQGNQNKNRSGNLRWALSN